MATQLNQDRLHVTGDKGALSNPKQSAGFVVDPMLTPTTVSSAPHPIPTDINPIDNPEHFDPSTRHPNTHYHPEKKLNKKKKAKKLGVGSIYPTTHALHGNHGVDTFSAHEKAATERLQKKEDTIALREQHHDRDEEEEDEDYEDDEDDHQHEAHNRAEATIQSKQQHHSERTTGHEHEKGKGVSATHSDSTSVTDKSVHEQDKRNDLNVSNKEKERAHDDQSSQKEKDDQSHTTESQQQSSSLLARASATATGLASKVMNVPVVNSIMSKVGLAAKSDTSAEAEKSEGGDSGKPTTNEEVAAAGK